jgi:hypothetical protein
MIAKNSQAFAHHFNTNAVIHFRTTRNKMYSRKVIVVFLCFFPRVCVIVLLMYFCGGGGGDVDSKPAQIDHLLLKVCDRCGSGMLCQMSGDSQNSSLGFGVC